MAVLQGRSRTVLALSLLASSSLASGCGSSPHPSGARSVSPTTSPPSTSTTVPGSGAPITLAPGLTLIPAPGWQVAGRQGTAVELANPAHDAFYSVVEGVSNNASVLDQLNADVVNDVANANGARDYSQVHLVGQPASKRPATTARFDQGAGVAYTATGSPGTGLQAVAGEYLELENGRTRDSVFIDVYANGADALARAAADVAAMDRSLEG